MSFPRATLVITDAGELRDLPSTLAPVRIILQLPMLGPEEQAEWQKKINVAANACGCGEGAAFLLIALLLLGLLPILRWPVIRAHPIGAGILSLVFVGCSVAAGKWFGKARAARKLQTAIDALELILKGVLRGLALQPARNYWRSRKETFNEPKRVHRGSRENLHKREGQRLQRVHGIP